MQSNKRALACSIISGNPSTFFDQLQELIESGISSFHFDLMDGDFVPRFGLYPEVLTELRKFTNLPVDVHMMVRNPELYIDQLASAGATTLTPHIEPLEHAHRTLSRIQELGCQVGLAINPGTPFTDILPVINLMDSLTIMAINPGIVGHKYINSTNDRIIEARSIIDRFDREITIVVDGGVTHGNAKSIFDIGANILVCGAGTVFKSPNSISENMASLFSSL
jgi:ribulose-phosphate 3-epimerase